MHNGRELLHPADLTEAERALVGCATTGSWWEAPVDFSYGPPTTDTAPVGQVVRAQVLYQLLTGHGELSAESDGKAISVRAVRVLNAVVVGHLDLQAVTLRCPLELVGCRFAHAADPVLLRDATGPYIRLSRSTFARGLDARSLTVRGDLDWSGIRSTEPVVLTGAHIGGTLTLREAVLGGAGAWALQLDDAQVGGSVFCNAGFTARGQVRMIGIQVGRALELSGGRFANLGDRCLSADRADVGGAVFAGGGFSSEGLVSFNGANVAGAVNFDGAVMDNEGASALEMAAATVGVLSFRTGFVAHGSLDLGMTEVEGSASFDGGSVFARGSQAVNLDGASIGGSAFFRSGFRAEGEVRLVSTTVGKQLSFDAGEFVNPGGGAIEGAHLKVGGSLYFRSGAHAEGAVRLWDAKVDGNVEITGSRITVTTLYALTLERAEVKGALRLQPEEVEGYVSLTSASVGALVDNEHFRSLRVALDGLRYDELRPEPPAVGVRERLAAIARDPMGYASQPYNQLAKIYRDKGRVEAARKVLVQSQRVRRRRDGVPGWITGVWSAAQRWVTGYGYRPWLAAGWGAAILVGGTMAVRHLHRGSAADFEETGGAPDFNAFLYTADTMLPFVDFGYGKWVAHGTAQVVSTTLVVSGWALATMLVAAFTSLLRRGD